MNWKETGVLPPAHALREHMDAEQRLLSRLLQGRPAQLPRWRAGFAAGPLALTEG